MLADMVSADRAWLTNDSDWFEPTRFYWDSADLVIDYSPYHPSWAYPRRFKRNRAGLYHT